MSKAKEKRKHKLRRPRAKKKVYQSSSGTSSVQIIRFAGFSVSSSVRIPDYDLAYMTLGKLSSKKDNAVLICHALSGSAHVAGLDKKTAKPGWWDFHVGPGKSIDTSRFFVIASNVIGGCSGSFGPSSVNPETKKPYGMSFPSLRIEDMVRAQVPLIDSLGIERLFAVIGGSMGGMQAMLWARDYPHRVRHCIPIASCKAHSAMQIAFNEIGRQAIMNDPNWQGGNYYGKKRPEQGLAVARMVGHVTYLSEYSMHQKFGRRKALSAKLPRRCLGKQARFPVFFSVESYLQYQSELFVRRFDPNSYLCITKALDMFDLFKKQEGQEEQEAQSLFTKNKVSFFVISFESDWLYPPSQSKELVRALKRARCAVSYINLETPYGHDSFLIRNEQFTRVLRNYLIKNYMKLKLFAKHIQESTKNE